ncbi:MAG: alpha-L-glutamate ligase-like protein [Candidatus Binatia bacterium]|nr:MAG: alpha-L-glutamate ligase-like protein [Candidatus Binatia bacterium]
MPLAIWRSLRERGVLGLNARNATYVLPENPRASYPRVDDKLLTKRLAASAGIPSPELLGVVSYHSELRGLPELLRPLHEFVLKPARGAQGNGILVVTEARDGVFLKSSGRKLRLEQIRQHVSSIISGVFSLRGDWDCCLVEALVRLHPAFADITWQGIPDIRVVVYRGVPVMAMCRLPTRASDGRANLHQGAIGVGIELGSGRAVHAVCLHRSVSRHPDTGAALVGFRVPRWDEVLELAARAADIGGLGYLGVDVVVDERHGPLLLELNARPGLGIQLANREGLEPRLAKVAALPPSELGSWQERCELARRLFSGPSS